MVLVFEAQILIPDLRRGRPLAVDDDRLPNARAIPAGPAHGCHPRPERLRGFGA